MRNEAVSALYRITWRALSTESLFMQMLVRAENEENRR